MSRFLSYITSLIADYALTLHFVFVGVKRIGIDFQIQEMDWANEHFPAKEHRRNAIGHIFNHEENDSTRESETA